MPHEAILAVDAGFAACGWAVLRTGCVIAVGCIRTEKSDRKTTLRVADDDAERCRHLARELVKVIGTHSVKGIVAELPSGGAKGARAISCMARAAATLIVVAELCGLPTEFVTPGEVKKVAGAKNASKEDVEKVVVARWPTVTLPKLKAEREHVSDALGAYLAAEHGNLVRMLTATA